MCKTCQIIQRNRDAATSRGNPAGAAYQQRLLEIHWAKTCPDARRAQQYGEYIGTWPGGRPAYLINRRGNDGK